MRFVVVRGLKGCFNDPLEQYGDSIFRRIRGKERKSDLLRTHRPLSF